MLEKIGSPGYEFVSTPDPHVLRLIQEMLENEAQPLTYYEIGVGVGATAVAVARLLDNKGKIYLFSFEEEVAELAQDLRDLGFHNIDSSWGSPLNTYSGYHFQLAQGFLSGALDRFDLAYVDGGHVFHLDAPAACVLKELCKRGGYMLFDDWSWTLGRSPTMAPTVRPLTSRDYDNEQINTPQVQLVCKIVMDTDPRFEFLGVSTNTAIYARRNA